MRYTYVRQHDTTDCAAACLAMVCLHYKKEVTISRLRDMMGTDMKGTNLVGLQKAANELGFSTAAVRVDRENFLSDFTLPAIAQVITDDFSHVVRQHCTALPTKRDYGNWRCPIAATGDQDVLFICYSHPCQAADDDQQSSKKFNHKARSSGVNVILNDR